MFDVVDHNRDHILPWLAWAMLEVTKSAEDEYIFAMDADNAWKTGKRFEYSLYDKQTHDFLGGIGLMKREKSIDMQFEIGFWLKKDACGKGFMQEAVKLIETEFFGIGVERFIIRNEVKNIKSKHVAEKSGYQFEGIQRHGRYNSCLKRFMDVNVFSKLKSDLK